MSDSYLFPGGIIALPKKAVEKLLAEGSGDAALLYLCLAAERDAARLSWPVDRVERAYSLLLSLGLADPARPVLPTPDQKLEPDAPPEYSTADITMALSGPTDFAGLVPEVERLLGKPLSSADLKTLYLLFDFLALPAEVILTLVTWCVERTAQRYGPGRKPTMNQIKKEGFRWQRAGVDTLEAADAHVRRLTQLGERMARLLELVEIRGRKPVGDERKYLEAWAEMGFQDDAIRLAYEKTILNTGKLTWSYLNKILRSWQQKGFHSAADAEEGEGRRRTGPHAAAAGPKAAPLPSDDIGRMIEQARQGKEGDGHGVQ